MLEASSRSMFAPNHALEGGRAMKLRAAQRDR